MESFLFCGLGNPGKSYEKTRHNIGFLVLTEWFRRYQLSPQNKFDGEWASQNINGQKVFSLMPQTFMNLSGNSLSKAAQFFKVPSENILVIYDELDLPLGRMKLKKGGGAAGHNGIRSIMSSSVGPEFLRLRLGIETRVQKRPGTDFVLGRWSSSEWSLVEKIVDQTLDLMEQILKEGFVQTQTFANSIDLRESPNGI